MQVVDQSGQKAVLAVQIIFMTLLKLVTFGRIGGHQPAAREDERGI